MQENSFDYFNLMLELFRARRNPKYSEEQLENIENFLCDEMDVAWYRTPDEEDFDLRSLIRYLIAQEKDNTIFYHDSKKWIVGRVDYSANLESWRSS